MPRTSPTRLRGNKPVCTMTMYGMILMKICVGAAADHAAEAHHVRRVNCSQGVMGRGIVCFRVMCNNKSK